MKRAGAKSLAIVGGTIAAAALYALFVWATGAMPRCPLKALTGLQCPGCGSQRALEALLQSHPVEAWSYNWMLPPLLLYLLLLLLLPHCGARPRALWQKLTSPAAIYILATVVVGWWIVRNILNI